MLAQFVKRQENGIPYYSCSAFEALPFVRHAFSTRHGGVSALPGGALNLSRVAWDAAQRVEENRARFMAALGLPAETLVTLSQVHSDGVLIIKETPVRWNHPPRGDALVTQLPGVALAVQVADCFPILLVDPETRTIACIHAGWRGALARIVVKTAGVMRERFGCDPARLLAAVGPGIRSCCFEVGPEVVEAFEREFPGARLDQPRSGGADKRLLELPRALGIQFEEAGVALANVFDLEACTRCRVDEFFSYRGEGPRSGRMMGAIALV